MCMYIHIVCNVRAAAAVVEMISMCAIKMKACLQCWTMAVNVTVTATTTRATATTTTAAMRATTVMGMGESKTQKGHRLKKQYEKQR